MLKRDGFRIEKLTYQTRPDVWVTANAYVPDPLPAKKLPAVLCVHGHWSWARIDPNVTARCLGLAKLGFFVLCRGCLRLRRALHQARPRHLSRRTLRQHPLADRPDAARHAGVRQPPGGGLSLQPARGRCRAPRHHRRLGRRQSDHVRRHPRRALQGRRAGLLRRHLSVLSARRLLRLRGAARRPDDGRGRRRPGAGAPRAPSWSSTPRKDNFNFSIGEAKKSIDRARKVFDLYSVADKIKHATFESPHAYNQPMREAMYGWMTRWLKGEGDGSPIAEPKFTPRSRTTCAATRATPGPRASSRRCCSPDARDASWWRS